MIRTKTKNTWLCLVLAMLVSLSVTVSALVPGDADGDGKVGAKDVSAILRYCAGYNITIRFAEADADASGSVNSRDAAHLMKYLSGWNVRPGERTVPPNRTSLLSIPAYSGKPYVIINGNEPSFTADMVTDRTFEYYGALDPLGRCTVAAASVGTDTMPNTERGEIGMIRPSGWKTVRYPFIDGEYLYNRCHLIGYQLTGENANLSNLITGTRSFNKDGMLPFENDIADYVRRTGDRVMYRVTPLFHGNDLVCRGVVMEASSVQSGDIRFAVFVYNAEPGVQIDYLTGDSHAITDGTLPKVIPTEPAGTGEASGKAEYVVNANTGVFHLPKCTSASSMKETNRRDVFCTREELISMGYTPCGRCRP